VWVYAYVCMCVCEGGGGGGAIRINAFIVSRAHCVCVCVCVCMYMTRIEHSDVNTREPAFPNAAANHLFPLPLLLLLHHHHYFLEGKEWLGLSALPQSPLPPLQWFVVLQHWAGGRDVCVCRVGVGVCCADVRVCRVAWEQKGCVRAAVWKRT